MQDVTIYLRAHTEPQLSPRPLDQWVPKPGWCFLRFGERVLAFDTETSLDASQRCIVGAYRLYQWRGETYTLIEEGLIRGERLGRQGRQCMARYALAHGLRVLSREDFCWLLIKEGRLGTIITGFNLPFDLGGLGLRSGKGRKRWGRGFRLQLLPTVYQPRLRIRRLTPTATLMEWSTSYDPKHRKANPGISNGRRPFVGRFLDLQTACAALWWGRKTTLADASQRAGITLPQLPAGAFGTVRPALIDRCRRDVELTWLLFLAVRDEVNQHSSLTPIPSPQLPRNARAEDTPDLCRDSHLLTRLHSPAGLWKAYLDAMGIQPRLSLQPDFSKDILGYAMGAFYGGRTDMQFPEVVLPVVTLDILATYLSVSILMDLWSWDVAERIDVEDATDDVRRWFSTLTKEALYHPETWRQMGILCLISPQGDRLPVRLRSLPGDAPIMQMKQVRSESPLPYMLPDLIRAWLETGRIPHIIRAWRFVPQSRQTGLRSVRFRGDVLLDPAQDAFAILRDARLGIAEARSRATGAEALELERTGSILKLVGEAGSYGIYGQVDEDCRGAKEAEVWGLSHFTARLPREEYPGRFYFPPRGALVTAGARLLLAMMERAVHDAGVAWVTMDTDSISLVSTESGGMVPCKGGSERLPDGREAVRALSRAEAERIVDRFVPLSGIAGRSLWKWEQENVPHPDARRDPQLYILAVGLKKYALFNIADDGRVILRKRTETALGHLVPPEGYTKEAMIDALWVTRIGEALGDEHALRDLPFAHAPALGRLPITTPDLLKRIRTLPRHARRPAAGGKGRIDTHRPRPFGFFYTATPKGNVAVFGGDVYRNGWCKLDHKDSVGCPHPQRECPYRAGCPLSHPVRPITFGQPTGKHWYRVPWVDYHTGQPLRIYGAPVETTDPETGIGVETFADVVRGTLHHESRWWLASESDDDIRVTQIRHTGKEARHLEEIEASLLTPEETVLVYQPDDATNEALRQALNGIPLSWLTRETGLHHNTIQNIRNGHATPYPATRKRLWLAIAARQQRNNAEEVG